MPDTLIGILLALTSAVVWGGGDFSGGFASRRHSQFQVLALSSFSGILILLAGALLRGEMLPSAASTFWAVLAGGAGAVGIASLYRALSTEQAATVAPITAVIGAALPVLFSGLTEGLPSSLQVIGFVVAFGGIWLVSQPATTDHAISQHGLC